MNGEHTRRWRLDPHLPSRTLFIEPAHQELIDVFAKKDEFKALPRELYVVKTARTSDSPNFIRELHARARVLAAVPEEPDYMAMFQAEVPAHVRDRRNPDHGRAEAVAALSSDMQASPDLDQGDEQTSVLTDDSTLNFANAFSGGAQVETLSRKQRYRQKLKVKKANPMGQVDSSSEFLSRGAQGAASAGSEASR